MLDLSSLRRVIWDRLVHTAQAACKSDPHEELEQDAAEAMGLVALANDRASREAGAAQLRQAIREATGHELGISLARDRMGRCSNDFASTCPMRGDSFCPRNLWKVETERAMQQAREARSRGVPWELAQKAARGELPQCEALRAASRFIDGKRNVLLFSSDDGDAHIAAAWAIYKLSTGRFVSSAQIRFAKRNDAVVQEVMGSTVLAIDDVVDLPKPAMDLLDHVVQHVCRARGKLILTTTGTSKDLLARLDEKSQAAIKKHGDVVPIASEQGALL